MISLAVFTTCVINITSAQNFNTDSLLQELKQSQEDTNKVNLYRNIGVSIAHQDPRKAIVYWKQGVALAKELNYDMGLARCYINIGTGYSFFGRFDSASIYGDTAIYYCHKIGDVNRLALVYLNKGDAYRNLQDFKKALLYCDTALRYADKASNTDRSARIYDIISDVYAAQKQFNPSIQYLNKALELYRKDENALMVGQVYSDFADIYKQTNEHEKAIDYYKKAIHVADSVQDLKNLSTYYADLADLFINQKKYAQAEAAAAKAVHFAKQQENTLQLATAYSHLCNLYIHQKKFKDALHAGNQAYSFSVSEDNLLWQKETATMLAEAYEGVHDHKNAYRFLAISKNLNDSIIRQHFNEETASLQASFEMKQKDKEIQLLNKDKELKGAQLKQQRLFLISSIALAMLVILGTALLVNRNRLRQRMKELQLRNNIAADLHDEVGSSLSSIHMLSQMASNQQKENLYLNDILHKVSDNAHETIERMSDIVWMIKPGEDEAQNLVQRMQRFMFDICTSRNIQCDFKAGDLKDIKLSMQQRKNLYLIFKEALNNAVKYSGTEKLEVAINMDGKYIFLEVKDFGKGFDKSIIDRGNGLDNMQFRAKELKGSLELFSEPGKGTEIKLSFPILSKPHIHSKHS